MRRSSHISVNSPRSISLDDEFDAEVIEFSLADLQKNRKKESAQFGSNLGSAHEIVKPDIWRAILGLPHLLDNARFGSITTKSRK